MSPQVAFTSAAFEGSGSLAIEPGANWLVALVTGGLAVGLCAIAVAVIGLLTLSGRMPVRDGVRVVVGCFVLLGAPVIATAFVGTGQQIGSPPPPAEPIRSLAEPRRDLSPSAFDPYAGNSLRSD